MRQGFLRQAVQIAGVSNALNPQAQRVDIAMQLPEGLEGQIAAGPAMVTGARFSMRWPDRIGG